MTEPNRTTDNGPVSRQRVAPKRITLADIQAATARTVQAAARQQQALNADLVNITAAYEDLLNEIAQENAAMKEILGKKVVELTEENEKLRAEVAELKKAAEVVPVAPVVAEVPAEVAA